MSGEWVGASKGLGHLALLANGRAQTDLMFAALFALAAFTVLLYLAIDRAATALTRILSVVRSTEKFSLTKLSIDGTATVSWFAGGVVVRLSDVCAIQSGYTARGRLEDVDDGGFPVISLRDFSEDGTLDANALHTVRIEPVSERFYCREGDIVFRSRGEKNTAFALGEEFDRPVVAVLPLMIIRPCSHVIDPQYLAWFINAPNAQAYFDAEAQGTSMRMISKPSLSNLCVDVPDLSVQKKIVEADRLLMKENKLMVELGRQREKMILASLQKAAAKSRATH